MPVTDADAELVRGFNRFYTKRIGLLRDGLLDTPYSLTQARVLFELGRNPGIRSAELCASLELDAGYLSRLLKSFEKRGLVKTSSSKDDARVRHLSLTAKGRAEYQRLNTRSQDETREVLARLSDPDQRRLTGSMTAIRHLLEPAAEPARSFEIRTHQPGDIGWVVAKHGEFYTREYGWDNTFEGLVATIAGKFLQDFKPDSECCWIAERDGERLGSVFLVRQSARVAKLRLLIVDPSARGLGVGSKLVEECIAFARAKNYRKLTLWTNDILHAARHIYERCGFCLVNEEKHHSFGHDLVGQFWELDL